LNVAKFEKEKFLPSAEEENAENTTAGTSAEKNKSGAACGCPAYFLEASFEPEARIGSAHNYQELSPSGKARRKFTSRLNSLIHL